MSVYIGHRYLQEYLVKQFPSSGKSKQVSTFTFKRKSRRRAKIAVARIELTEDHSAINVQVYEVQNISSDLIFTILIKLPTKCEKPPDESFHDNSR